MSASTYDAPDRLEAWEDICTQYQSAGLLVGNGSSRAVWEQFRYDSLYEQALFPELDHHLDSTDQEIFERLGTTNFETVLNALTHARVVAQALGHEVSEIASRYDNIRDSLIAAVNHVHIEPQTLSSAAQAAWQDARQRIRAELLSYRFVFSTNYDLLIYWAIMADNKGEGFRDYFWSSCTTPNDFDITDTDARKNRDGTEPTCVLYLHGALHLVQHALGYVSKIKWQPGKSILDQFANPLYPGAVPLFVSEGTFEDKERVIRSSYYLTFAFERFTAWQGPLVIFGHRLDDSDRHLVRAMNTRDWMKRRIAISIRPGEPHVIRASTARYIELLPKADLCFFDATTHPLGVASLSVSAE